MERFSVYWRLKKCFFIRIIFRFIFQQQDRIWQKTSEASFLFIKNDKTGTIFATKVFVIPLFI